MQLRTHPKMKWEGFSNCCDDEEKVIPRLFEILKGCVGWEIIRIGDLDVDI
jgi:hypothetical protein